MRILDLTNLIQVPQHNHYVFNPSLVHVSGGQNLFLMTYRKIVYNLMPCVHPWTFWVHGRGLLSQGKLRNNTETSSSLGNPTSSSLWLSNSELGVGLSSSISIGSSGCACGSDVDVDSDCFKYKTTLSPHKQVVIPSNQTLVDTITPIGSFEFDGTGLCLLSYDLTKFRVIKNINNLFGKEMNQDTRLYQRLNNEWVVTYNCGFLNQDGHVQIKMLKRQISFDCLNQQMQCVNVSREEDLLISKDTRSVEKNCILMPNDEVLYRIQHGLVIQNCHGDFRSVTNSLITSIENSMTGLELSLSTPVIPYEGHYLGLGHAKVTYKGHQSICDPQVKSFLAQIDWSRIKQHGKYLYFAFFLVFDKEYQIIHLSDFFIPTNSSHQSHLPYLLVFPTGLTEYGGNYLISYGEGDVRCKVLELNQAEITRMLSISSLGPQFRFLDGQWETPLYQAIPLVSGPPQGRVVVHHGYFGQWNCGDDAFVKVFQWLHQQNPIYQVYFSHLGGYQDRQVDLNVLGGGDVINSYFIHENDEENQGSVPWIAFGVGIPYLNQIHLLKRFKSVVLRNSRDLSLIMGSTEGNVSTLPDLTWILVTKDLVIERPLGSFKKIGVALPRTYYHPRYEDEYRQLVINLGHWLDLMSDVDIYLIPFCINLRNHRENDLILNQDLYEISTQKDHLHLCYVENNVGYVEQIMTLVNNMDGMICGRFHAHIFSAMYQKPFVSLSCSRKCRELMNEWDLSEYLYPFQTNQSLIPIEFKAIECHHWIMNHLWNPELREKIQKVHRSSTQQIPNMIETYYSLITDRKVI